MVVDALDLCYTKSHVDTFVIVSGGLGFSPLVSSCVKQKIVIGVGVKKSTSDLLMAIATNSFCTTISCARSEEAEPQEESAAAEAGPAESSAGEPDKTGGARPRDGDDRGAVRGAPRRRRKSGLDGEAGAESAANPASTSPIRNRSFGRLLDRSGSRGPSRSNRMKNQAASYQTV